ncbi:hypothetical protein KFL_011700010 [Klebsormidium nitens]|uniref:Uncharacterized protein n=1 Tax=Klebsormidium nitens TaxID=105231 RepID=A0A1Y1IPL8_KLENI|nr:hypothetical protein KFL_011700010 [Klebsormidium nitens]|eukprot:GAQ92855.1 hypothetical protein KFL_011700010 [Klebsormidium nitens]
MSRRKRTAEHVGLTNDTLGNDATYDGPVTRSRGHHDQTQRVLRLFKRQREEGPSVVAPIQEGLVEAHAQATANYESQIEILQARIDEYQLIQNQTDNELRREWASRGIVNSQLTESKRRIMDLEKDIERIRREGRKTEDKLQNELDYEKRSRKVQMDRLEKERSAEMKKSLAEQAEKHRKREEELRILQEKEKARYDAKVDELREEREKALTRQKELSEAAEAKRATEIEDLERKRRRAEEEVKKLKEELQKKEHEREVEITGWSHVRKGLTLANQQLTRENTDLQTAREEAVALMDRLRTVYKNLQRRAYDLPRPVETDEELTNALEPLIKDLVSDRSRQSDQLDDIFQRVTRALSNFRGFCERAGNRVNLSDSNDIQTMIGNLENSLTHAQKMHEGARETILELERTAETRKRDLERALRDLDDLLSGTVRADASEQVKTIKDRLDAAREEARAFGKAAARAEELRRAKEAEAELTGAQLERSRQEVRELNSVVARGNEREESIRKNIREFEKLCRDALVSQEHREQLLNHADPKLREVGSIVKTLLDSKESIERALRESRERERARMELDDEIEELKASKRALEVQNAELIAKASDLRNEVQRSNAEHEREKSRMTAEYRAREAAWQRSAQDVSRQRETWMQEAKSRFEQVYATRVRELDGFRAQAAAEVDAHRADRVAMEGRVLIAEQKAREAEQKAEQRIAEIGAQVQQIEKNYTDASEEKQRKLEELNVQLRASTEEKDVLLRSEKALRDELAAVTKRADESQKRVTELTEEINDLNSSEQQLTDIIARLRAQIEENRIQRETAQSTRNLQIEGLRKTVDGLKVENQRIQLELERVREAAEVSAREGREKDEEATRLRRAISARESEIGRKEQAHARAIAERDGRIAGLEADSRALRERIEEVQRRASRNEAMAKRRLGNRLAEQEGAKTAALAQFSSLRKEVEDLTSERKALKKLEKESRAEATKASGSALRQEKRAEMLAAEVERLQRSMNEANEEIDRARGGIRERDAELNAMTDELRKADEERRAVQEKEKQSREELKRMMDAVDRAEERQEALRARALRRQLDKEREAKVTLEGELKGEIERTKNLLERSQRETQELTRELGRANDTVVRMTEATTEVRREHLVHVNRLEETLRARETAHLEQLQRVQLDEETTRQNLERRHGEALHQANERLDGAQEEVENYRMRLEEVERDAHRADVANREVVRKLEQELSAAKRAIDERVSEAVRAARDEAWTRAAAQMNESEVRMRKLEEENAALRKDIEQRKNQYEAQAKSTKDEYAQALLDAERRAREELLAKEQRLQQMESDFRNQNGDLRARLSRTTVQLRSAELALMERRKQERGEWRRESDEAKCLEIHPMHFRIR